MATQTIPTISMEQRDRVGSRYATRLRKSGRLPAVIYGHKEETLHVSVDAKELTDLLHENHHLLQVALGERSEPCLVKAIQWDHLGDKITHVDLSRVDLSETVEVEVELELIGDPKALDEAGAILDRPMPTLVVSCRADSIPDKLTHDIGELTAEKSATVSDLVLPAGVTATVDGGTLIAQIQIVQEEPEEEEEVVEAAEGEPQIIGKADETADDADDKGKE